MNNQSLRQLYEQHQNKVSDKWSLYLTEYDRLFSPFRHRPINLLEIGIQNGGSLEIWAAYFSQIEKIVGCDINENCHHLIYEKPFINVVVGDANHDSIEQAILAHAPLYDIIIDDGSHYSSDIIKSFARYFPHLKEGGIFIVEDLHCSYWEEFEGGLFDPFSSMSFFKRLIDILNYRQWGVDWSRSELLAGFSRNNGVSFDEKILSHIHSIEFINSICVIRKAKPTENELGHRVIAGQQELVQPNVKIFKNSIPNTLNQLMNPWTVLSLATEQEVAAKFHYQENRHDQHAFYHEQLIELDNSIASRDARISNLEGQVHLLNAEISRLIGEPARITFNAAHVVSCLCARIAPVGTRRNSMIVFLEKVISSLKSRGFKGFFLTASRYLWSYFQQSWTHKSVDPTASFERPIADPPQLAAWIAKHEPSREQLSFQKQDADQFPYQPLISVIIPIYQLPLAVLRETLDCLIQQTYSNWQACIVWADSEDMEGWEWLQEKTKNDQRFKIKRLDQNGGISLNSNEALRLADGEYIALLDHDDTVAPCAFYEVVKLLQSSPNVDFIYSDKDSITANGQVRLNGLFKPGWSPEMLHSVNYLTHLNIMRTQLVREIGGWNPETDGAQDWDIFFRITEKTERIAHLPSLLYHWRILSTSTATGMQAKPYAAMSQLKAQQNYFKRKKLAAAVVPTPEGLFHVKWPIKREAIYVIVYQTGSLEQLVHLLNLLRLGEQSIIHHISVLHYDPYGQELDAFKHVWGERLTFIQSDTIHWHSALMLAMSGQENHAVVLLDGRASGLSDNVIGELAGWVIQHPEIAWTSAVALHPNGTVYEAGRVVAKNHESAPLFHGSSLFSFGWLGGPLWYRNTSAASPYAIAINSHNIRPILSHIKKKEDQGYCFSEFCLALTSNGRRGLINPFAKVYFDEAPESTWQNEGKLYHDDPYFHQAFDQVSPLRLCS